MPGRADAADARKARAAMVEQRVDQRAVGMAGGGMDDEAGRLVDDDQMLVLVDDVERDVLALDRRIPRPAAPRIRSARLREPHRRVARDRAVDQDPPGLDQRLEPRPRQRDPPIRRRQPEETVEPLARPGGVNAVGLRPRRRGQGRRERRFNPCVARRLAPRAPGPALALAFMPARGVSSARPPRPPGARRGGRARRRSSRGSGAGRAGERQARAASPPHAWAYCRNSRRQFAPRNRRRARRMSPSVPACRNNGFRRHAIAAPRRWPWRSAPRPAARRSCRGSPSEDRRRRRRNWRR